MRIALIVRALRQAQSEGMPAVWISELARRAGFKHHEQVTRILNRYLSEAVSYEYIDPFRLRFVRLKEGFNLKGHLRYLRGVGKL